MCQILRYRSFATLGSNQPFPAKICPNFGESDLDEEVIDEVYRAANGATGAGEEVDVREFSFTTPQFFMR